MEQAKPEGQIKASGLTMVDLLNLPDSERQLVNWMRRHADCTLAGIAAHLCCDEVKALALLDNLLSKGYIYQVEAAGQPSYHVQITSLQRQRIPQKMGEVTD